MSPFVLNKKTKAGLETTSKRSSLSAEGLGVSPGGACVKERKVLLSAPYRVFITDLSYGYPIFIISRMSPPMVVSKCAVEVHILKD